MSTHEATPRGQSAARELDDIAAEQADLSDHMEAVMVANRVLRKRLRAHPPSRAKAWQHQVALVTRGDYEPNVSHQPRWGVTATVFIWHPEVGEDRRRRWAPTWREAIAAVMRAVFNDEP